MDAACQIRAFDQSHLAVVQPIAHDPHDIAARRQHGGQRAPERHNRLLLRRFAVVESVEAIVQEGLMDLHGGRVKPHGGDGGLHGGGRGERGASRGDGVGQLAGGDQAAGECEIAHKGSSHQGVRRFLLVSHVLSSFPPAPPAQRRVRHGFSGGARVADILAHLSRRNTMRPV